MTGVRATPAWMKGIWYFNTLFTDLNKKYRFTGPKVSDIENISFNFILAKLI